MYFTSFCHFLGYLPQSRAALTFVISSILEAAMHTIFLSATRVSPRVDHLIMLSDVRPTNVHSACAIYPLHCSQRQQPPNPPERSLARRRRIQTQGPRTSCRDPRLDLRLGPRWKRRWSCRSGISFLKHCHQTTVLGHRVQDFTNALAIGRCEGWR
jgi:hypothetical protein